MNSPRSIFGVSLPAPAPHELIGLLYASSYLRRVGTVAATQLLEPVAAIRATSRSVICATASTPPPVSATAWPIFSRRKRRSGRVGHRTE